MPTRPDSDRWLFGVTLALCLFGAVMILSASAVTAEQLYGHSYIFLVRQAAWLLLGLLGMFVLMRTDYHKLRQPAVIYAVLSTVLVMLVSAFFLDRSHATHRWIRFGPVGIQPSELAKLAVILYLAWFLDLKRRDQDAMEFCKEGFLGPAARESVQHKPISARRPAEPCRENPLCKTPRSHGVLQRGFSRHGFARIRYDTCIRNH